MKGKAGVFEELCSIMCTKLEIMRVMGMSEKELDEFCIEQYGYGLEEAYDTFTCTGKVSLRRAQIESAIKDKSVPMMIFMGKNVLGQSDAGQQSQGSGSINIVSDITLHEVPVKDDKKQG